MKNGIDSTVDKKVIHDVVHDECESRIAHEMGDVTGISGEQIVEANYCISHLEQAVTKVAT